MKNYIGPLLWSREHWTTQLSIIMKDQVQSGLRCALKQAVHLIDKDKRANLDWVLVESVDFEDPVVWAGPKTTDLCGLGEAQRHRLHPRRRDGERERGGLRQVNGHQGQGHGSGKRRQGSSARSPTLHWRESWTIITFQSWGGTNLKFTAPSQVRTFQIKPIRAQARQN